MRDTIELAPGDVVVTNHPGFGGSHLPDVTVVTPVFSDAGELLGFTASRAHHAEIGGARPGSMPPGATTLAEEGVVLAEKSGDYVSVRLDSGATRDVSARELRVLRQPQEFRIRVLEDRWAPA